MQEKITQYFTVTRFASEKAAIHLIAIFFCLLFFCLAMFWVRSELKIKELTEDLATKQREIELLELKVKICNL